MAGWAMLCQPTVAQQPVGLVYNKGTGLPDHEVYDLIQAKDRSIWLACNLGLYRYNGATYQAFSHPERKSLSISYLRQDSYGRIWCCSFFGQIFYVENGTMHLFARVAEDSRGIPADIIFDSSGRQLYVFTDTEVLQYSLPTGAQAANAYRLSGRYPFGMMHPFRDASGKIWLVNMNSIAPATRVASLHNNRLQWYWLQQGTSKLSSNAQGFFEYRDSIYLYERWTRKLFVQRKGAFVPRKDLPALSAINYIKVLNDQIYVLTKAGAYKLNENLEPEWGNVAAEGLNVSAAMVEKEGALWLSTLDAGIISYPPQVAQWWSQMESVLGTYNITAMRRAGSHIVVGANNGAVGAIDIATGRLEKWHQSNVETPVIFMHYDATWHNLVWMTTSINLGYFKEKFVFKGQYLSPSIKGIEFLGPDSVVYASGNEAALAPRLNELSTERNILLSKRTRAVWQHAANGQIWLATGEGVLVYQDTVLVGQLLYEGKPIYATCFAPHPEGLMIGTYTQGVLTANPASGVVREHISHQALKESAILQMELTPYGLFVLGNKGLLQYNFATGKAAQIGSQLGLNAQKINAMCWYQGQLWLATTRGVVKMQVGFEKARANAVPVVVKEVMYNGKALPMTANLQLPKSGGNLQLVAEYPHHDLYGNFRFRYRLNEDSSYTYTEAVNNRIYLNNFPAGRQTLYLEVVNNLEEVLATAPPLVLRAPVPYYAEWWFIMIVFALLVALIYTIVKKATARIQKAAAEKLEKEMLKSDLRKSMLTSIKAQMNPHFIFNALNTVQSFMYANNKLEVNAYLSKFSSLIRLILDMSTRDTISLQEEINALSLYLELEQIRFEDSLTYAIHVQSGIDTADIYLPSMIVQPYVENALKHGLMHRLSNRVLTLHIRLSPHDRQILEIEIDDNGVGRQKSAEIQSKRHKQHKSFSSSANLNRLNLLNADTENLIGVRYVDKTDEAGQPAGTTVFLNLSITTWRQKHNSMQHRQL
jgi:ligand-binding sensor domain-containing protein